MHEASRLDWFSRDGEEDQAERSDMIALPREPWDGGATSVDMVVLSGMCSNKEQREDGGRRQGDGGVQG